MLESKIHYYLARWLNDRVGKCLAIGMRSWHDDTRRLCCSVAYTTVRRTYCDQHRNLRPDDESREKQNQSYYEFSENESLVNSLESSRASDCRFERRLLQSPTSCLKSVVDVKKNNDKKRVNFADKEASTANCSYASSSIIRRHQSSENAAVAIARRRDYVNQASDQPTMRDIMQSSTSALEELSLSSSGRCCAPNNPPRIVKPRDVLRRPSTRKMIIYPPEGQQGEPLTMNKKWSKIQCCVNGDEDTGFRYKVYYLQTFESDKWFPNSKTNSPFYHLPDDDNSTDYGN